MRGEFLGGLVGAGAASTAGAEAPARKPVQFQARDFGAIGDGVRPDTKALQAAIDACAEGGGGTVVLPAGKYLSGTLVLKSNITLLIEAGAVLLGSRQLSDYPSHVPAFRSYTDTYTERSLLYAENAQNLAIAGRGTMDGQGKAFSGPYKMRPYMIRIIQCRNVTVSDVTIENSPMWVQHYLACEEVIIRGIRVHSRVNQNNDGIDIDCCQKVAISGCEISSGDDAIVLKSTADRITRDVTITGCVLSSACNALKLGTESNGGFENIAISNCTIYNTRLAGLALETVDGGVIDRVTVTNLTMDHVGAPIFLRLGDRGRPFREGGEKPPAGSFRNVTIGNVEATGCGKTGCAVAGLPGHPIENVTLHDIRLQFTGGGRYQDVAREIPENSAKYPEYNMFGMLPAYGLFCRHVRGLRLDNIDLGLERPDERPAVMFDDVEEALVQGCRLQSAASAFLRVRGSKAVSLIGNDLSHAEQAVDGEGVFQAANRLP